MKTIAKFSCVGLFSNSGQYCDLREFAKTFFPESVFIHVEASRLEFSDDVNSRTARQDYLPYVIKKAKDILLSQRSVIFDMTGVKEQDENRMRNSLKSLIAPWYSIEVEADKTQWKDISLDISEKFDYRDIRKNLDIVGDIHGCIDELLELCRQLNYEIEETQDSDGVSHFKFKNQGRTLVFVGDFIDRGPDSIRCLSFCMDAIEQKAGLAVIGNHDLHLFSFLTGEKKKLPGDLGVTVEELLKMPISFQERVKQFIGQLPTQLHFDSGRLIVTHAGCPEIAQGLDSPVANKLSIFGDFEGVSKDGRPIRSDWAEDYHGSAIVVHGHTPIPEPYVANNVYCIDTGCVFGGALTTLSYPELEMTMVPAKKIWSTRPESESFWNSEWRQDKKSFKF